MILAGLDTVMFMRIMLFGVQLFLPMSVVGMAVRAFSSEQMFSVCPITVIASRQRKLCATANCANFSSGNSALNAAHEGL